MLKFHNTQTLSAKEELEYAKLAAKGDKRAKEKLVLANIPFVFMCSKAFRGYGLSNEELVEEGIIGLVEAVNRFDWSKGVRLITYAKFWICLAIQKALNESGVRIRLSEELSRKAIRLRRGFFVNCGKKQADELLKLSSIPFSLDTPFSSDGEGESYSSFLADTKNLSVEEECERNIAKDKILDAISELSPNERDVIILHYGLCNREEHSFEAIGAIKGRTRARMQQIEKNAFKHLRENLEAYVS